jgi:hypothetical protein
VDALEAGLLLVGQEVPVSRSMVSGTYWILRDGRIVKVREHREPVQDALVEVGVRWPEFLAEALKVAKRISDSIEMTCSVVELGLLKINMHEGPYGTPQFALLATVHATDDQHRTIEDIVAIYPEADLIGDYVERPVAWGGPKFNWRGWTKD